MFILYELQLNFNYFDNNLFHIYGCSSMHLRYYRMAPPFPYLNNYLSTE